jgi:RNA polymerase sigma-70 factor (ECF subfamily)
LSAVENGVDEQLLVAAAQRDPCRFAELYEQNFERVYSYIARRVPTREEAEDITAEVFHQALANIGSFQWRGTPFVAWLFGIAGNVLASRWRKSEGAVEVSPDALDGLPVHDEVEQRITLSRFVESLPPDQRLVVTRRFLDQRSVSEIASEIGRTEGAVKQLQFRALQTLRNKLRGSHHE